MSSTRRKTRVGSRARNEAKKKKKKMMFRGKRYGKICCCRLLLRRRPTNAFPVSQGILYTAEVYGVRGLVRFMSAALSLLRGSAKIPQRTPLNHTQMITSSVLRASSSDFHPTQKTRRYIRMGYTAGAANTANMNEREGRSRSEVG